MKNLKNAKFIFILLLSVEIIYASICCAFFYDPINISVTNYPPATSPVRNLAIFTVPVEVLESKKYDNVSYLDVELVPENYSGNYIQYKASKLSRFEKQIVNIGLYPVNIAGNAIPATIDAWQVVVREHLAEGDGQILKTYSFHYGVTWEAPQVASNEYTNLRYIPLATQLSLGTGIKKQALLFP